MTRPRVMDNNCAKRIQIQNGSEELWPGHRFWVCVHCYLDPGQGHDTSLGHGQQSVVTSSL